jgi:hypothetical protein
MPECPKCLDFGTVLRPGMKREGLKSLSDILREEEPCDCPQGDEWRRIAAEWNKPVPGSPRKPERRASG